MIYRVDIASKEAMVREHAKQGEPTFRNESGSSIQFRLKRDRPQGLADFRAVARTGSLPQTLMFLQRLTTPLSCPSQTYRGEDLRRSHPSQAQAAVDGEDLSCNELGRGGEEQDGRGN